MQLPEVVLDGGASAAISQRKGAENMALCPWCRILNFGSAKVKIDQNREPKFSPWKPGPPVEAWFRHVPPERPKGGPSASATTLNVSLRPRFPAVLWQAPCERPGAMCVDVR